MDYLENIQISLLTQEILLGQSLFCKTPQYILDKKGFGQIDSFFGHPEKSVEITEECLRRLKYPKLVISTVSKLVKYHDIEFAKKIDGEITPNGFSLVHLLQIYHVLSYLYL